MPRGLPGTFPMDFPMKSFSLHEFQCQLPAPLFGQGTQNRLGPRRKKGQDLGPKGLQGTPRDSKGPEILAIFRHKNRVFKNGWINAPMNLWPLESENDEQS